MNAWEMVFRQSRVNNGYYEEDPSPQLKWDWPKGTWFQSRLYYVRDHQPVFSLKTGRKTVDAAQTQSM